MKSELLAISGRQQGNAGADGTSDKQLVTLKNDSTE